MKITKNNRRDAKQFFRFCTAGGVLDENRVREVVTRVLQSKPRGYLPILSHFQRLVKLDIERRTGRVESAAPLTPDLQASVRNSLAQNYGPGLNISFTENPALIGGMRVQVGSDVYDGTIQARLAALESSF